MERRALQVELEQAAQVLFEMDEPAGVVESLRAGSHRKPADRLVGNGEPAPDEDLEESVTEAVRKLGS